MHLTPNLSVDNDSITRNTPFVTTVNAGNVNMELPPKVIFTNKNYVLNL
ncbi:MAG: hypothetical protein ACYDAJ_12065 [Nitrosotalea sp.]